MSCFVWELLKNCKESGVWRWCVYARVDFRPLNIARNCKCTHQWCCSNRPRIIWSPDRKLLFTSNHRIAISHMKKHSSFTNNFLKFILIDVRRINGTNRINSTVSHITSCSCFSLILFLKTRKSIVNGIVIQKSLIGRFEVRTRRKKIKIWHLGWLEYSMDQHSVMIHHWYFQVDFFSRILDFLHSIFSLFRFIPTLFN